MTANHACPECQTPLPTDAPAGLCPRCLLQRGLGSDTSGPTAAFGQFTPPSVDELRPLFPQLEIIELLGQGGMGAVYKARQPGLDRLVALKLLPPAADASFAERFTREARTLAKLNHPGIVTVHDFGQAGGLYYFVMEFVEGVNLRQAQQAHKLTPAEALAIVPKICEALQIAHDAGVVHRDIKPENILIDAKGRVKIADFGLVKLLDRPEQSHLTHTHQAMGTLHYMAPEQWEKPLTVDHRADIYSLGVVFYELLTGELPLGRFAAPSQKVQVDVRIDDVVLRTLEKEPDRRYQHASDVKTDVERIGSTGRVAATNESQPPRQMELLLDETDHLRRQTQHMGVLAGEFLVLVGGVLLATASSALLSWFGGVSLAFAVIFIVVAGKHKQRWEIAYRGHRILFVNSVLTGSRLFIDGEQKSRSGIGFRIELKGIIPNGDGAGDRITAWTEAGFRHFRLRLFAEPAVIPEPTQQFTKPTPIARPETVLPRQNWDINSVIALFVILATVVIWPVGLIALPTLWWISKKRKQSMVSIVENAMHSLGLYHLVTWSVLACLAGLINAFFPWVIANIEVTRVFFYGFDVRLAYEPPAIACGFLALGLFLFTTARLPSFHFWRAIATLGGGIALLALSILFITDEYGFRTWNAKLATVLSSFPPPVHFTMETWPGPYVAVGLTAMLVFLGALDLRSYLANRLSAPADRPDHIVAVPSSTSRLEFLRSVLLPTLALIVLCAVAHVVATRFAITSIRSIAEVIRAGAAFLGPLVFTILLIRWLSRTVRPGRPRLFWASTAGLILALTLGYLLAVAWILVRLTATTDSHPVRLDSQRALLVGTWSGMDDVLIFHADGTVERETERINPGVTGRVLSRQLGQYRWLNAEWVELSFQDRPTGRYKVSITKDQTGGSLTFLLSDGTVWNFKRVP
jgi:tRNA A-37 threonylcarbamoyl transferase component Bud32